MTTIVFAESSGANPYASQNAAVSASAGSHGNSSYGTPRPASCPSSQRRPASSCSCTVRRVRRARRGHRPPLPSSAMTDRSTTQHPTAPPDIDAYLARFDWHPEPELVGYRDEARLARRARAARRRRPGRPPSTSCTSRPSIRAMGDAVAVRRAPPRATTAATRRPGPGAGRTRPRPRDILDEFAHAARRRADERPAPAPVRLLHAAAAADVDHGRAARPDGQPGRRRLARRPVRRLRRGGGRPLAVRPRRLRRRLVRPAHVGRRHGQLHGHGARPRPAPRPAARDSAGRRAAATSRAPASTPATRRTSRSRGRSTCSGSRRRPSSIVPVGRRIPPARRARSPRPSRATGPPASRRSRSRRSPARRTPARSTRSASSPTSPRREDLWLHVDAAYGGGARLSARDADRVPDLDRADSVTVDPHKWFFQAYDIGGLLVRDGSAPRPRPSAAGRPSTTAAARAPRPARRRRPTTATTTTPRRPAELLQAQLRGHPPLARAQALDVVEAPRDERLRPAHRGQRRPGRATSPGAAPRPTTSRPCPRSRSCRSSASATCPAVATRRLALAPASSTPTRTDCSGRSSSRATAG